MIPTHPAMKMALPPGLPTGIDPTELVIQMVHRAASSGFESWPKTSGSAPTRSA